MRGGCLCGAVRFEATPSDMHCHACHCEMCRRWTGSAMLAVPVPAGALRFEDEGSIRTYRSSEWAERAFCGTCGSTLYYRLQDGGDSYLALGLFDEPDALPLASELYIDRKPSAFAFAGERKRMTKAEVEAQWSGSGA
jgi:hypothetical protein